MQVAPKKRFRLKGSLRTVNGTVIITVSHDAAVVPARIHPPGEGHGFADVLRTEHVAEVGAVHWGEEDSGAGRFGDLLI